MTFPGAAGGHAPNHAPGAIRDFASPRPEQVLRLFGMPAAWIISATCKAGLAGLVGSRWFLHNPDRANCCSASRHPGLRWFQADFLLRLNNCASSKSEFSLIPHRAAGCKAHGVKLTIITHCPPMQKPRFLSVPMSNARRCNTMFFDSGDLHHRHP